MMFLLRVWGICVIVASVLADHFRGGTINWRPNTGTEIDFQFRLGFELGKGPGCNAGLYGSYVSLLTSDVWVCSTGCGGRKNITSVNYYCGASHLQQNWEQGENRFKYNFPSAGIFTVSYTGRTWIPLDYGTTGDFHLQTSGDIRKRSDIKRPNSSPLTASLPVYEVPFGCKTNIHIPMYDADGDVVACRWAVGKAECGSACNGLPNSTLSQTTCSLELEPTIHHGYVTNGWYAVTLVLEDYPRNTTYLGTTPVNRNHVLCSVPLQFVIHTRQYPTPCSSRPTVTSPTPHDGQTILVPAGTDLSMKIYAKYSTPATRIREFVVSPPPGLKVSPPINDDLGRPDVWYSSLSWKPNSNQKGPNILCFEAMDSNEMTSEQRCFVFIVGDPHPCDSGPCQNNGTCSLGLDTFVCSCINGFNGTTCGHDIDECQSNHCQNGGTCWDRIGYYQCLCPVGFVGDQCQYNDNCGSSPCDNLGICVSTPTGYNCTCMKGYTDPHCQTELNECYNDPCENGGRCQDMVGDYFCRCPNKYKGRRCEVEIDYCNPSSCKNGGNCRLHKDSYSCSCPSGYFGLNCELHQNDGCSDPEDSYCMCNVDGRTVKIPFPEPVIQGLDKSDLIAGVVGFPIGVAIGGILAAIWHYVIRKRCLKNKERLQDEKDHRRQRTRPTSSTSSTSSLLDRTSPTSINEVRPGLASPAGANVYRSGFHDEINHKTGERLNDNSYTDGMHDWTNS